MIEPLGVSIFMFMLLAYRDRPAPIDVSFTNEPTVVKREGDMSPALPAV